MMSVGERGRGRDDSREEKDEAAKTKERKLAVGWGRGVAERQTRKKRETKEDEAKEVGG